MILIHHKYLFYSNILLRNAMTPTNITSGDRLFILTYTFTMYNSRPIGKNSN